MSFLRIEDLELALADAIRRVGLGEWITIVHRGVPVARLDPPSEVEVRIGSRFDAGGRIAPFGHRLTDGVWREVLAEDRGAD